MHSRADGEKSPEFLNHSATTHVLRIDFLALVAFIFHNHASEKSCLHQPAGKYYYSLLFVCAHRHFCWKCKNSSIQLFQWHILIRTVSCFCLVLYLDYTLFLISVNTRSADVDCYEIYMWQHYVCTVKILKEFMDSACFPRQCSHCLETQFAL